VKELIKDKEIGVPEEFWFFKDIKGPEFEKLHPFMSLAEVRAIIEDHSELELRELVKVKERTGTITNLVEDKSSILYLIGRLKPKLCRIYVLGINDAKANQIEEKIGGWLHS
jgi:hypothetical protein